MSKPMSNQEKPAPLEMQGWPIVLQDVSKCYGSKKWGKWALQDVSFTIEPGVFGLLGRNGAGKTTLLQILATLLDATAGNIYIGPYEVRRERWQIRNHLGFLPQEQGFYPQLTVKETLRYLAAIQGLEQAQMHIDQALAAVNLRDRARSRVSTLSGGMRRRLGLAQALLGDPRIIIVDEPTAGLDPVEQQRFRTLLGTIGAQGNRTVILSTHIVADIATVARRVAVLEQGKLSFTGTIQDLTAVAHGQCWLWRTSVNVIEDLHQRPDLTIISLIPVVDGESSNEVLARVVGSRPSEEATPVEPGLEDGYFSLIGGASEVTK